MKRQPVKRAARARAKPRLHRVVLEGKVVYLRPHAYRLYCLSRRLWATM
jgi:hypothetical protein